MRLTIAYSKIKKRNLVLINNDTYQRETLSERSIRQPLKSRLHFFDKPYLRMFILICNILPCDTIHATPYSVSSHPLILILSSLHGNSSNSWKLLKRHLKPRIGIRMFSKPRFWSIKTSIWRLVVRQVWWCGELWVFNISVLHSERIFTW